METLLQSSRGFDDWIELIVIVLFIAGSILGPVVKKLITSLSQKEEDKPQGAEGDLIEIKPGVPEHRQPPARPVARPMPTAGQRQTTPDHPIARPLPAETVARPVVGPASSAPTMPVGEATQKPRPPRRLDQPKRPPLVRPPARPVPKPVVTSQQPSRTAEPTKGRPRMSKHKLKPALAKKDDSMSDWRQTDSGDVHSQADATLATTEIRDELAAIRHPSRRMLRRAIVMSEILGPPVALRPPADMF